LLRELVRKSEFVGFELMEFEAPSNPGRRARAVQNVLHLIEAVFLAVNALRMNRSGRRKQSALIDRPPEGIDEVAVGMGLSKNGDCSA
jgi:hypothetical protein